MKIDRGVANVNFALTLFLINRIVDLGFDRNDLASMIENAATKEGFDEEEAQVFREVAEATRGKRAPRFEVIEGGKDK